MSWVAGCQAGGPLVLSKPIDTGLAFIRAGDMRISFNKREASNTLLNAA
jgi:hypothetical protein